MTFHKKFGEARHADAYIYRDSELSQSTSKISVLVSPLVELAVLGYMSWFEF